MIDAAFQIPSYGALWKKPAHDIKAESGPEAAEQLRKAAALVMQNPAGLGLRGLPMITDVSAQQNTMTVVTMPSESVSMARGLAELSTALARKEEARDGDR